MDHFVVNKKDFQEARPKAPEMRSAGCGNAADFLCVLCNWLLSAPYQSFCGDRACYDCLKLLTQKMEGSGCKTITCPGCGCGKKIAPDKFFPDKAVTRDLNKIHVACPNERCSWEGQYCDYYDEHCHSVPCSEGHAMTDVQDPSYDGTFIWRVHELTRRRRDAVLGKTHVDGRITEITRQLGDNLAIVQQLKSETQTRAAATEDAITKLQHAVKELQDYYSDLALSVQTLQATSYNGIYIWKVPELTRGKRDAVLGKTVSLYSAPFFTSRHGYKLCLHVYLNGDGSGRGTHVSFFIILMKGEFDPLLPWPFKQTVSLSLLAQDGMSRDITQSFKPDEDSSSFQVPKSEMNVASGCPQFCSLAVLENPAYVKNDTIYLKGAINLRGIEHIL